MIISNPGAGISEFVELQGTLDTPAATGWTDWDLSAVVGAGAKYALVVCRTEQGDNQRYLGARADGSALVRHSTIGVWNTGVAMETLQYLTIVDLGSSYIIERYCNTAVAGCKFGVVGYWK